MTTPSFASHAKSKPRSGLLPATILTTFVFALLGSRHVVLPFPDRLHPGLELRIGVGPGDGKDP